MREPNASGDRLPLTEPQQPRIDEHADHPGPESLGQKGRADGRVDPSRQPADNPLVGPDPAVDLATGNVR